MHTSITIIIQKRKEHVGMEDSQLGWYTFNYKIKEILNPILYKYLHCYE